jgi:hypothetical protein
MVFNESLGGKAEALAASDTPSDVKAKIRADIKDSLETVAEVGARNRQQGRWATRYELRDRVMAGLQRDASGKPKRKEPKRLAREHNIPVRQIEKWIAQLRATAAKPALRAPTDWRDIYHGEALRHHYRLLGRQPKNPKG